MSAEYEKAATVAAMLYGAHSNVAFETAEDAEVQDMVLSIAERDIPDIKERAQRLLEEMA